MSTEVIIEIAVSDLRIIKEMLVTMHDLLHEDQPECGDHGPMELIVETSAGQVRNITKHVPVVVEHLDGIIEEAA